MKQFQIPSFFDTTNKDKVYRINYAGIANDAVVYKNAADISNAVKDKLKVALMIIDAQNTFCIPGFELFVSGAPDDNERLAKFMYGNLERITKVVPTMDTHELMQIFHPLFWLDANDQIVAPMTMIGVEDLDKGTYKVNPAVVSALGQGYAQVVDYARFYVKKLEEKGKYKLTVWPYHAILTGIGHALTSLVEEAVTFHAIARNSKPEVRIKGGNPLTENYSVIDPEVTTYEHNGNMVPIADSKGGQFLEMLLKYDAVIIAGQAKSHCVAWTIDDILRSITAKDPSLAKKIYLLEDCTSPVIVPGIVDFTQQANDAFIKYAQAGMNLVNSTTPMDQWPSIDASKLQ
jgi:nicotinamidase-related amidase